MSSAKTASDGQRSITPRYVWGAAVMTMWYNMYRSPVNAIGTAGTERAGTASPMESLTERLEWLRKRANVRSMREAARLYGIGYEVYKKIEKGERSLTKENAAA